MNCLMGSCKLSTIVSWLRGSKFKGDQITDQIPLISKYFLLYPCLDLPSQNIEEIFTFKLV